MLQQRDMRGEDPTDAGMVEGAGGARGRAVVIGGQAIVRRLIAGLLEEVGFEAGEADDGSTGLRLVARARPDLAVLDLALSNPPGTEVLARIRADPPTVALPVLLVAGPTAATPAPGPDERLLRQPFSHAEFVRALEALVPTGLRASAPGW